MSRTFRIAVGLCTYPAAAPYGAYAGAVCRVGVVFEVLTTGRWDERVSGSFQAPAGEGRIAGTAVALAAARPALVSADRAIGPIGTSKTTPTRHTAPAYAPYGAAAG